MAFLLRFLSLLFLMSAIAAATVDSIVSVSSSSVVLTSFGDDWQSISPASLDLAKAWVEHYIHPEAWRSGAAGLRRIAGIVPAVLDDWLPTATAERSARLGER